MPDRKYLLKPAILAGLLLLLEGCEGEGILSSAGPVSEAERTILLDSLAIMLAIVIPTIIATLLFAWWFRASNTKARYLPDWSYSGRIELLVWSIPMLTILFLGIVTWVSAHDLDPSRPLNSKNKPLNIQVVAFDWKWLFIYPDQHIASINHMVVPVNVPLHLNITSASVFNVFFVPRLGSQIYAMNGMDTQLNLEADKTGDYPGLSAHFSGDGFSGMAFDVLAVPKAQFTGWIASTQQQGPELDNVHYRELLKQSQNVKPYTYRTVQAGLFDAIVTQQLPQGEGPEFSKPNSTAKPEQNGG